MIPHRILSNQVFANGLKGRVSACRKRLRFNRPTRKAEASLRVGNELEQVFPERALPVNDILDEYPAERESLSHLECSAAFVETETSHSQMLPPVEEQGVGIT
jgi:hypothetical protein